MKSERLSDISHISSVQFSHSVVSDSLRPHEPQHARPPCPSPTPRVHSFMCIESVMSSSHLILCHPLLLPPPIPPSIRVFSNESTLCMRWPKYWSFSFNISPSKEHPGLISFRMDWLDLLAVQGMSGGCAGTRGPRGAIPRSRSGGAAVRRYPSSKVRSSGYALLEQP